MSNKLLACGVCKGAGCSYCRNMNQKSLDEIERLQAENERLITTFGHYHVANTDSAGKLINDSCAKCCMDLRNPIHFRETFKEQP